MVTETDVMEYLRKQLKQDLLDCSSPRERRVYAETKPAVLRRAVKLLWDEYHPRLITISAVDNGLDIQLLYHFSVEGKVVTLRAAVPKETNEIESITDMIPAAHFIEREIAELFGVKFLNHPHPERLILPKNWPPDNHPLRKPLEGALPPMARLPSETLLSTGCLVAASSYIKQKREKAGLPQTPPAVCGDEKKIPEFQELIKETSFDEKAGYDWEKKKLRYK